MTERAPEPRSGLLPLLLQAGRAFLQQKDWAQAVNCARQVLEALSPEPGDRGARSEALDLLASGLLELSDHAEAEAAWTEALALLDGAEDHRGMARIAARLGAARRRRGDLEGARLALLDSLRFSAGIVPGVERAEALEQIGMVERSLGHLSDAQRHLAEGLRIFEAMEDSTRTAGALDKLGNVSQDLGELSDALDCYQRALVLHERSQDRASQAAAHNNVAGVLHKQGDRLGAIENFSRARQLFQDLGQERMIAITTGNLAVLHSLGGDLTQAEQLLREAVAILRRLNEPAREATFTSNLAMVCRVGGRLEEAIQFASAAIRLHQESGKLAGIAKPLMHRARALLELGRTEEAKLDLEEARREAERAQSPESQCDVFLLEAWLALRRGHTDAAAAHAASALEIAHERSFARAEAEATRVRATIAVATGQDDRARELLEQSEEEFRRLADPFQVALCRLELGQLLVKAEAYEAAATALRLAEETFARLPNVARRCEALLQLAAAERRLDPRQARGRLAQVVTLAREIGRGDLVGAAERALEERESKPAVEASRASGSDDLIWIAALLQQRPADVAMEAWLARAIRERWELGFVSVDLGNGTQSDPAEAPVDEPEMTTTIVGPHGRVGGIAWSARTAGIGERTEAAPAAVLESIAVILGLWPGATMAGDTPAIESRERRLDSTDVRLPEMIVTSPSMRQLLDLVARVAPTQASVLIRGESGTGKELVARRLHERSGLAGAFIGICCPAIPRDLIEAELFGHEKGAFTGADSKRVGQVDLAEGGTLFLDEIGDMDLAAQTKLLRFLEQRDFLRVGGREPVRVNVRLVAATSRDLHDDIRTGRFRSDLLHRLNVVPIDLPPLRERTDEIAPLVRHFAVQFAAELDCATPEIAEDALRVLEEQTWSGNVRELRNLVYRLVAMQRSQRITVASLPREYQSPKSGARRASVEGGPPVSTLRPGETLPARIMSVEGLLIREALARSNWNQSSAARRLGISESTLRDKLRRYAIERPDVSESGPVFHGG